MPWYMPYKLMSDVLSDLLKGLILDVMSPVISAVAIHSVNIIIGFPVQKRMVFNSTKQTILLWILNLTWKEESLPWSPWACVYGLACLSAWRNMLFLWEAWSWVHGWMKMDSRAHDHWLSTFYFLQCTICLSGQRWLVV